MFYQAASIAALQALTGMGAGDVAFLTQAGREGMFVFSTSNHSSQVTADTLQGIYVAPSSDTTGASGAWVREFVGAVNLTWFGAVADCTAVGTGTDSRPALVAAIASLGDNGGQLFIPEGRYRISARVDLTTTIRFMGEKIGQNAGVINQVPYSGTTFLYGSVLIFDTDQAGLRFYSITDFEDHEVIAADIATHGTNSQYYEFPSSNYSHIENLTLMSAGSSDLGLPGIESRIRIRLDNVVVRAFAGPGVKLWGQVDGEYVTVPYGNADLSVIDNVRCVLNKGDGFNIQGRDGNVIRFTTCDAIQNGGWGFNDQGFLGNLYLGCHCNSNAQGSYRSTEVAAWTTYIGCYIETGTGALTSLTHVCVVIGGNMASNTELYHPTSSRAMILGAGLAPRGGIKWSSEEGDVAVSLALGVPGTSQTIMSFGAGDESGTLDAWKFFYDDTNKVWNLRYANSNNANPIQFMNTAATGLRTGASGGGIGPAFRSGFYFGALGIGTGLGPYMNTSNAAPSTGTWNAGDNIWNTKISTPNVLFWHCSATGTPGTWHPQKYMVEGSVVADVANIAAGASDYVNVTVTGAALGDVVVGVSSSADLGDDRELTGRVNATNNVRLRIKNNGAAAYDPASMTYRAVVRKQ